MKNNKQITHKDVKPISAETLNIIRKWSKDRGLDKTDPAKQLGKLQEEVDELKESYNEHDFSKKDSAVPDSVGDILVVLTIFCQQTGLDMSKCLNLSVDTIKNRTGKTVNGVFIKDEK